MVVVSRIIQARNIGEGMSKKYVFEDLIKEVMNKTGIPMRCKEIWEKAIELKLDQKIGTKGKTPWDSISALLYTSIKEDSEASEYIKVSKRPTRFTLKTLYTDPEKIASIIKQQKKKEEKDKVSNYHERDLHPLLVK